MESVPVGALLQFSDAIVSESEGVLCCRRLARADRSGESSLILIVMGTAEGVLCACRALGTPVITLMRVGCATLSPGATSLEDPSLRTQQLGGGRSGAL